MSQPRLCMTVNAISQGGSTVNSHCATGLNALKNGLTRVSVGMFTSCPAWRPVPWQFSAFVSAELGVYIAADHNSVNIHRYGVISID